MEEAFAAGAPPVGIGATAHAAALAWTMPGFAAFHTGGADDDTAVEAAPVDRPADTPDASGDADPAPADKPRKRSIVESIEPPAVAERRAALAAAASDGTGETSAVPNWHYPLPVVFENVPATPAGGEELERHAFLDGALNAERWRGLVFGVFKDRWNGFGLNDPDINFHGLTVSVRLPSVETVAGAR